VAISADIRNPERKRNQELAAIYENLARLTTKFKSATLERMTAARSEL